MHNPYLYHIVLIEMQKGLLGSMPKPAYFFLGTVLGMLGWDVHVLVCVMMETGQHP